MTDQQMAEDTVPFDKQKMPPAWEQIIITNQKGSAPLCKAMVFQIPPTVHEHNVITTLLQRLRVEYPGAWFCVQEWERRQKPTVIGPPAKTEPKVVTKEHLGLPKDDPIMDMPV